MVHILSGIVSLMQYKNLLNNNPSSIRLERCVCCGKSNPWRHGSYSRQSDRLNPSSKSLNPVCIQRYYCPSCQKCCSVLPECIPPRRWYLWELQQLAFLLCINGASLSSVGLKMGPSRQTISRWFKRFKEQYQLQKDILCGHVIAFGRATNMIDFWSTVLKKISLAEAMRFCHVAGIIIP